jgi:hypothetical protein
MYKGTRQLQDWDSSKRSEETAPNKLAASNIPAGLPAWAQFSRRTSDCKSWTGLQDLAPTNQEPKHYSPPLSQTTWCLESQLEHHHSRTVKTIFLGIVTEYVCKLQIKLQSNTLKVTVAVPAKLIHTKQEWVQSWHCEFNSQSIWP